VSLLVFCLFPQPSPNHPPHLPVVSLCPGLVTVGGGVFVCIYSSTVAWTAVLGRFLLGRRVVALQWLGVFTVCVGLGLTALAHAGPSTAPEPGAVSRMAFMVGVCTTLLGSLLHSGMLVLSDGLVRGLLCLCVLWRVDGASA
jgi:drug/metabolite transporter (DMT)-like permease